jgi:hypothetical protein
MNDDEEEDDSEDRTVFDGRPAMEQGHPVIGLVVLMLSTVTMVVTWLVNHVDICTRVIPIASTSFYIPIRYIMWTVIGVVCLAVLMLYACIDTGRIVLHRRTLPAHNPIKTGVIWVCLVTIAHTGCSLSLSCLLPDHLITSLLLVQTILITAWWLWVYIPGCVTTVDRPASLSREACMHPLSIAFLVVAIGLVWGVIWLMPFGPDWESTDEHSSWVRLFDTSRSAYTYTYWGLHASWLSPPSPLAYAYTVVSVGIGAVCLVLLEWTRRVQKRSSHGGWEVIDLLVDASMIQAKLATVSCCVWLYVCTRKLRVLSGRGL